MKGYKPHKLVLTAGETGRISAKGKFFRVLESSGDLVFFVDGERADFIQKGIGVPVPEGFKELEFLSTTSQTIIVGVAETLIYDNRLSLDGAVNVVDESFNKSVSKSAFEVYYDVPAQTGKYSAVGLWNPVGSGVTLAVKQVIPSSIGGGNYQLLSINQWTVDFNNWNGVTYKGDCKNTAEPSQSAKAETNIYIQNVQVPGIVHYYRFAALAAGSSEPMIVEYPWIIQEGTGLVVASTKTGQDCAASFEWEEYK